MAVVNFVVKEKTGRWARLNPHSKRPEKAQADNRFLSRYECCFHVQEYNSNSVAATRALITSALTSEYEDGGVAVHTTALAIGHLGKSRSCQRRHHAWRRWYLKAFRLFQSRRTVWRKPC